MKNDKNQQNFSSLTMKEKKSFEDAGSHGRIEHDWKKAHTGVRVFWVCLIYRWLALITAKRPVLNYHNEKSLNTVG